MKLSLFTSAALLVLTAPFAIVKAASLRAVSVQDSNDNNAVLFELSDPLYTSNAVSSEADLEVGGGLQTGFIKFTLGGFHGDHWSTIDISDYDAAIHQAFNEVHGKKDGIYFAGEKIYKIVGHEGADNADNNKDVLQWSRYYDSLASVDYRCRWCPDDDASSASSLTLLGKSGNDIAFDPKKLDKMAKKACEILNGMDNEHFKSVEDCSAVQIPPETFTKNVLANNNDAIEQATHSELKKA